MARPEVINFHHIGARSGSNVPVLRMLGDEQRIWLYDADPDCLDQVAQSSSTSPIPTRILPYFVGIDADAADFHLNYDLYTSSCLPYNDALDGVYQATHNGNGDYLWSEALRCVNKIKLPSRSLDSLMGLAEFSVDYLLMDTQGGELNILKGAEKILDRQCLAIVSEINFEELYKGQPSIGEIFDFCRSKGFRFMRLDPHTGASWFRAPVGWRGRGAELSADALFYKDPQVVRKTYENPDIALRKLAMIALVGGYFEFCLECLSLLDENDAATSDFKYVNILNGMYEIFKNEEKIYPPSFSDIYSLEEANFRFLENVSNLEKMDVAKLRQRYFSKVSLQTFKEGFPKLCAPEPVRLERYLIENQLGKTAEAFRTQRLKHALTTARLLGLTRGHPAAEAIDLSLLGELA